MRRRSLPFRSPTHSDLHGRREGYRSHRDPSGLRPVDDLVVDCRNGPCTDANRIWIMVGIAELGRAQPSRRPSRALPNGSKREEARLATGILNSGPTVGAVVAPLIVPLVALHFGWRGAFVLTGALGFGWLAGWLILYRQPEAVKRASRPAVAFDTSGKGTSWVRPACRQTWAYAAGKVFADPAWFFYLYWLPSFLPRIMGFTARPSRLF